MKIITKDILDRFKYDEHSPSGLVTSNNHIAGFIDYIKEEFRYRIVVNGNKYHCSRIIYALHNINFNQNNIIDHIDGNTTNNIISNLRECSSSQNSQNRKTPKNNSTNYKNIFLEIKRNRYVVSIMSFGKVTRKCFPNTDQGLMDAISTRNILLLRLHKEFANFGDECTGTHSQINNTPVKQ